MKLSTDLQAEFESVKSHGDIGELMKCTGIKSHSHMGKVMKGEIGTTVNRIAKISKFLKKRINLLNSINNKPINDQN